MPPTVWASDRLIYRATEPDDDQFLLDMFSDPSDYTNRSRALPTPLAKQHAADRLKRLDEGLLNVIICLPPPSTSQNYGQPDAPSGPKSSADKPKPIPVGQIGLRNPGAELQHHRGTVLSLSISRQYQGKGYGSEAIQWCLNWAFHHANMHRVEIGALEYNTGAVRLYEKLGFVIEGRKRQSVWYQGEYRDVIELAMLRPEWEAKYGQAAKG
ncbi:acyl-CoA N-acyltransferase [Myriangium duriaei CBS 260.36]|uniref:Acyl-CoA N-acyltransferase n=1 Tax=Myriangium duriaei CBS 260.36 TaxID=1168546 RepID=A0A9P4MFD5_9PEZI|nr:acyl-CoA N-acyltransferase [Myriangium duriaei CBS 260.36]